MLTQAYIFEANGAYVTKRNLTSRTPYDLSLIYLEDLVSISFNETHDTMAKEWDMEPAPTRVSSAWSSMSLKPAP